MKEAKSNCRNLREISFHIICLELQRIRGKPSFSPPTSTLHYCCACLFVVGYMFVSSFASNLRLVEEWPLASNESLRAPGETYELSSSLNSWLKTPVTKMAVQEQAGSKSSKILEDFGFDSCTFFALMQFTLSRRSAVLKEASSGYMLCSLTSRFV